MTDKTYNGWTNYETWNCALWIDNDQGSQEYLTEQARDILKRNDWDKAEVRADLADAIESFVDEQRPDVSGMFADLLSAAIGAIEWRDRADSLDDGIDSECLADDAMSGDRTRIEQMVADLREAADDCQNGSGEYGCTVAGYHYFVSKI